MADETLTPQQRSFFDRLMAKPLPVRKNQNPISEDNKDFDKQLDFFEKKLTSITLTQTSIDKKIKQIEALNRKTETLFDIISKPLKKHFINVKESLESYVKKSSVLSDIVDDYKDLRDNYLHTLTSSISKSYSNIKNKIQLGKRINEVTEKSVTTTLKVVNATIQFPLKLMTETWSIMDRLFSGNGSVNKLLSYNIFSLKSNIKAFMYLASTPVRWILNVGKTALEFSWKALKTLFVTVPYAVIKKAVDIAGKGIKVLASWMTDMFMNIFRFPWILFIGIPFLIFVVPIIVKGVWNYIKKGAKLIWDVVDKYLHISYIWNEWVWPSINRFWAWLTGDVLSVWWDKNVPAIKDIVYKGFSFIFGKSNVDKFIYASKEMWIWAKYYWENIKFSYNILKRIFRFLMFGFLYKSIALAFSIIKLLTKVVWRASKFILNITTKILGGIVRFGKYIVMKLAPWFGKFLGVIKAKLIYFIKPLFKLMSKSVMKVLTVLGVKLAGKLLVRFIPIIGQFIGLAWDFYDLGVAVFQTLKARAARRDSAHFQAVKSTEFLGVESSMISEVMGGKYVDRYGRYAEDLKRMGFTQQQIATTLQEDVVTKALTNSALFFETTFRNIFDSVRGDSNSEQEEVDISYSLATKFGELYNFISQMSTYNMSIPELKAVISHSEQSLNGVWNDWVKLNKYAQKGIASAWISDTNIVSSVNTSFKNYENVIKMAKEYVKIKENSQNTQKELNKSASDLNIVADTSNMMYHSDILRRWFEMKGDITSHLSGSQKGLAENKLLKAMQFASSNGIAAKDYVMAGLSHHIPDDIFLSKAAQMFDSIAEIRGGHEIPIFVPTQFSTDDISKFANGGIVVPHETKNVVLPLNNTSQEYIRKQVETINAPEIKKLKKEYNDITIIEQHVAMEESYELYAMNKLSRGLLGVG